MTKADLAREAVEKFPHTSKKAIAAYLYKHNPIKFKDAEDARRMVRAVCGKAGTDKGKHGYTNPTHKDIYKGLPQGEKNDFSPFVLKPGTYGALFDLHIPYHDLHAIESAIEKFIKDGVKNIILGGDVIDCYQLSRWDRDPRKRKFSEEVNMIRGFLKELKNDFNVIYKMGNHEERYEKFLIQKAPELFDMEILAFENVIGISGIEYIKNKKIMQAGKLNIVHGHEFGESIFSPVNPARGLFLKAKVSAICGHYHQSSEHMETNMNGKVSGAWSVGCLCDLSPHYRPLNKWQHGFATVHHDGDEFEVNNYKIINGKVK